MARRAHPGRCALAAHPARPPSKITDVRTLGRRRWKKEAGSQLQARVENAFFRYKSILGDRLRARSRGGRVAESVVACNVLNQMTELGRPESYSIGR